MGVGPGLRGGVLGSELGGVSAAPRGCCGSLLRGGRGEGVFLFVSGVSLGGGRRAPFFGGGLTGRLVSGGGLCGCAGMWIHGRGACLPPVESEGVVACSCGGRWGPKGFLRPEGRGGRAFPPVVDRRWSALLYGG